MDELALRYQRSDNMVFRKIENEAILVPIKNNVGDMGSIFNLNEVGAFIWDLLDGSHTLADVRDQMLQEFDVSSKQAEHDLRDFLAQLEQIDAIEPVS
jgi:hypothetical protein